MDNYTTTQQKQTMPSLPANSYLPVNRCNLPAKILGSLAFQAHPVELLIDGVFELHNDFFVKLSEISNINDRKIAFVNYMQTFFSLSNEKCPEAEQYDRIKADYLCMLRGWMFDSNNREGAIIKGWIESRFGLLPRWHKQKIDLPEDEAYAIYMHERTTGIYNTNAIEAQLDLLYSFCQHELKQRYPDKQHFKLYRGTDFIDQYDLIERTDNTHVIIQMNSANSLSKSSERAGEFGSTVLEINVPKEKIFYFDQLLDQKLQGEGEHITIGGLYRVKTIIL